MIWACVPASWESRVARSARKGQSRAATALMPSEAMTINLQGDTLGLGGFAHAETVAHQDGNAHVEGHARQEEQGFDAQSGGEARQGIDAVEGQGCHQDEEHEVAGLPDDAGRSAGRATLSR